MELLCCACLRCMWSKEGEARDDETRREAVGEEAQRALLEAGGGVLWRSSSKMEDDLFPQTTADMVDSTPGLRWRPRSLRSPPPPPPPLL
ncbi:hypothetical protein BHE74_00009551 [Ensete ventricosum]|nr:hypothetical protein GW17_00009059 [Ensete ventricosum]RWW82009.1 hypothetical protein BHE74_00009551 [Ensete ventricosum]